MRVSAIAFFSLLSGALAGNCGPQNGNAVCATGECCSQYGWCGTTVDHCDSATCLKSFSGKTSKCAPTTAVTTKATVTKAAATTLKTSAATTFPAAVPNIDVCGHAQGGVTCPGAGTNGYFYRCCSSAGHCGPKNDIQDQALYCGDGCQAGYGKCNTMAKPPVPSATPGTAGAGENCGPIVNKKCGSGLCCSGSNYCGAGTDFCGAANWCQSKWGKCN
ncbi:carbohydrate-binding module family 18 protein [Dothidotthia symphoricarpi CBS 119687]|uniref:Carbohydrate-binding module family 18 protein n=1 Tax=Dothidotthia symphoricarpi CBS 119687 TaxID=1392245 RepID=A0A6A6AI22_9PLEO|nr:carbohydrate-binding module family 18 protein [Dothidotthia symphoricarpi CBS 119687]KAF2130745.1 carbohydrate-binding module family 18 protein [Dothidotthia symphoricarpi CBS 119687]